MRRVLVTGSRNWTDQDAVFRALYSEFVFNTTFPHGDGPHMVVVHGDCPTGADAIAHHWAVHFERHGAVEEPHPANWDLGKKAGPLRNQAMVDLGADVCLAFPGPDSRGTRDCMSRAEAAGIPVVLPK